MQVYLQIVTNNKTYNLNIAKLKLQVCSRNTSFIYCVTKCLCACSNTVILDGVFATHYLEADTFLLFGIWTCSDLAIYC